MSVNDELVSDSTSSTGEPNRLAALAGLAFVAGIAAGLVGAVFRLSLVQADHFRDAILDWARTTGAGGFVAVVAVCAAAAALAAWLVRRFAPPASGSGIPHVEAVLKGEQPPAPLMLLPVKFVGGVLAMGAGLALGREGPSVQMGACLGGYLSKLFRRGTDDGRALLAAGAGAGLATAFNAPIAGAAFVLEELVRRFDPRITITTLCASASAIAVARVLLGEGPDFDVQPLAYPGFGTVPVHLALGLVAGLLGIAYNRTLLATLAATWHLRWMAVEVRAALIGAAIGLLAWYAPDFVGGGDLLTQRALTGPEGLFPLAFVFLLRFALGAVSYAAGTPGGLFAPLLVLGSQSGLLFGMLCERWIPGVAAQPAAYAVVGMAAFFTAVVRAPLTGIILVVEMTGNFTQLLPMLVACGTAMLVPTLLGNEPIYDSLRQPPTQQPMP